LEDQTETRELGGLGAARRLLTRLSFATLTSAVIQGLCVFVVASNAAKVALGLTGAAGAAGSSIFHSDPVRLTLRYVSAVLATLTLYVVWNGRRLRNRAASQWRKVALSRRQKRAIGFALLSALGSWCVIIAEVFAHQRMHRG